MKGEGGVKSRASKGDSCTADVADTALSSADLIKAATGVVPARISNPRCPSVVFSICCPTSRPAQSSLLLPLLRPVSDLCIIFFPSTLPLPSACSHTLQPAFSLQSAIDMEELRQLTPKSGIESPLPGFDTADFCWPLASAFPGIDAESPLTFAQHDPSITHQDEFGSSTAWLSQDMPFFAAIDGLVEEDLYALKSNLPEVSVSLSRSDELQQAPAISPTAVMGGAEVTPPNATSSTVTSLGIHTTSRNGGKLFACPECHEHHANWYSLVTHRYDTGHCIYSCRECSFVSRLPSGITKHIQDTHGLLTCQDCNAVFDGPTKLNEHIVLTDHSAYQCNVQGCGQTFSRMDIYRRHTILHRNDIQRYPCPHCKRYRGSSGFRRKDHLTQHLRNYHHIGKAEENILGARSCPHEDCSEYRKDLQWYSNEHAFKKVSEYTMHMKNVHDESPFPCLEPACNRIGGKGYFRKRDLIKHQKKEHPNAQV